MATSPARLASTAGTATVEPFDVHQLHRAEVKVRALPYSIPAGQRAGAESFLSTRLAGRVDAFDGPIVGLAALQVSPEGKLVAELQHGGYFAHLASDIGTAAVFGAEIAKNAQDQPYADTPLLHAIGVSAIALTSDNALVVVRQSQANESSIGLLAPSGSGSLEPADIHPGLNFGHILQRGALREMHEELGLLPEDIKTTRVLGLARWVEKAGKPEAFVFARLKVDAATVLQRKISATESAYVAERICLSLTPSATWDAGAPESLVVIARPSLSLPLLVALHLFAKATSVA